MTEPLEQCVVKFYCCGALAVSEEGWSSLSNSYLFKPVSQPIHIMHFSFKIVQMFGTVVDKTRKVIKKQNKTVCESLERKHDHLHPLQHNLLATCTVKYSISK